MPRELKRPARARAKSAPTYEAPTLMTTGTVWQPELDYHLDDSGVP